MVAMAGLLSGYLLFLGDMGLGTALISKREVDPRVIGSAYGVSAVVGLALFLMMVLSAPLISSYFGRPELTRLVQVSSTLFLAVGISTVPRALLAVEMKFREISIAGMASSLTATVVTLSLAFLGAGPYALVLGMVAGGFSRAILLQVFLGRMPVPSLALSPLKGLLRLSGFVLANMSVWYWYTQIDVLIVGRRLGDVSLGLLTAGKELAFLPVSKLMEVTNQVALPAFSRIQDDLVLVADRYSKSVRLAATLGFPILWGMAVTADDMVSVLLGPQWIMAVVVIQAMCVVMPLRLAGAFAATVLQGIGRPDLTFRYTFITLVVSVAILLVSTQWGLVGVTVAWCVSIPVGFYLGLRAVAGQLPVTARYVAKDLVRSALPSLVMVIVVFALKRAFLLTLDPAPRLAVSVIVGMASWLASIRTFSPSYWEELLIVTKKFIGIGRG